MRIKAAFLLIFAGILLGGMTVVRASLWPAPEEQGFLTAAEPAHADPMAEPVGLEIPTLGVKAEVVDVGIAKSGNMAVPPSYSQAGWFRYGPHPGELGSAVMDGHVDNGFGLPAVFKRLHELKAGDELVVLTKGGERRLFRVERVETYAVSEVPAGEVFARADAARLNLITCTGEWDAKSKTYDERVVVYALYMGAGA